MLLFLDFDGVLHPSICPEREYFSRLPLFSAALRGVPRLSVAISSSWRHFYSLTELRAFFPADIAGRIVGATPQISGLPRHAEILDYLARCAAPDIPWLALDDSRFEFPAHCPNLLLCDGRTGFTEADAERLRRLVERLAGAP